MRVAYVIGTSAGGTGRHVRMLAEGLAGRGVTVSVYGPARTWTETGAATRPARPAGTATSSTAGAPAAVPAQTPGPLSAGADRNASARTPSGTGDASARTPSGTGDASARTPSGTGDASARTPSGAEPPQFTAVEIADHPRPARDLAAVRRLRALFARSQPDIIHAHGLRAGALAALAAGRDSSGRDSAGCARAGTLAARRDSAGRGTAGRGSAGRGSAGRGPADAAAGRDATRPALVVTVHNAAPAGGPARAVYRLLERLVACRADAVLCVSSDLEERMRRLGARGVARALVPAPPLPGVSAETTRELAGGSGSSGFGVSPESAVSPRASTATETLAALRAELGVGSGPARTPVILAVARLAPQKGLDTLVEAAARWRDREPRPLLAIAGTGPLRASLAGQAEAAGVRVRFLGHRDDVPALLAAADVVVLPSRWEGQPLVVQETLRAGRPLVASRVGGIPDLTGEDAALLVPPGDAAALAAAVLSVLDDPGLPARLGEAARRRAGSLPSEADALDAALAGYRRLAPG